MGLLIDLTNTDRFYNKADVETHGCHYLKLQCRGHGETPSIKQTKIFIEICKNFIAQNPLEIIGVHCTHGFKRTGFLLISYSVFIDRDNSVFQVSGLKFPHPRDLSRSLKDTLLDGEMVIDKVNSTEYPRYLAYDVIMYDGNDVSEKSFFPDRYTIIEREIMGSRYRALNEGIICREQEPFPVRLKHFWDITQANSLLSAKFAEQLGHQLDGLIFQPSKEPYIPGTAGEVLKWKPINSVDFKLKIVVESGMGILTRKIGHLYIGGFKEPFDHMKITEAIEDLHNKIIECTFENGHWVFMRERTDKSFPNSFTTAQSVCHSIRAPITAENLCNYIEIYRFKDDSDCLPPPCKRRR
ncbi:mRNA-capping enzyme-like [Chelonus insularis]|uniref:mRNA-capping enzyme-like n=1 Tax=Chelonus insularis TaxID=460826 RepID=UPI00158C8969|nr:mRNA-capping enzyme-like [Chelonus insularis]